MDKDYLIQLTKNLYHLTLFFPKKEPLRYKMREVADEILIKPNEEEIDTLDKFFEIAKAQNWVKQDDIFSVQKEYANLKEELAKAKVGKKKENPIVEGLVAIETAPRALSVPASPATERQEKILEYLRENGRAQVWEIKQILPEVTKRTLRRDFEHMLNQGIIERIGERNSTYYQLKTVRL